MMIQSSKRWIAQLASVFVPIVLAGCGDSSDADSSGNSATGSFAIKAGDTREVQAGQLASYDFQVESVNGFAGTVTFSEAKLPSAATATFSVPSVDLAADGTAGASLSIQTSTSTPIGTHTPTIIGTSGALSSQGAETLIVLSAAGTSKIAFMSTRQKGEEIYVMNTDGTNLTRLTNNQATDRTPVFSPDGAKIAFQSGRDGNPEVYVMSADGTNPTRLTNNGAIDEDPAWSPDGAKVVFSTLRDGNSEIYVMNADGTNPTRLTNNPVADENPAFSPDGSKIAFFSMRDKNLEIYVMNADGTNPTRLTNDPGADSHPSFSGMP